MAADSKTFTSIRSAGRTPPFILIGLLLILGFLGYSYWSLTSSNSELSAQLDKIKVQKKDIDGFYFESEKKLLGARDALAAEQAKLRDVQGKLQTADSDLAKTKIELSNRKADSEKYQNQLNECNTNLEGQIKEVQTLKNEKEDLAKQLQEAKDKPATCDLASCTDPVKNVLTVAAKLVGSEALKKALSEAKFDAAKLMEGIEVQPPSDQKHDQQEKEKDEQKQPKEQKEVKEQKQDVGQPKQEKEIQPESNIDGKISPGNETEQPRQNSEVHKIKAEDSEAQYSDLSRIITESPAQMSETGPEKVNEKQGENNPDVEAADDNTANRQPSSKENETDDKKLIASDVEKS